MAGWFSRARGTQNRESDAQPPDYELRCSCGSEVRGERVAKMQVAVCQECGAQLFVMPRSAYPRPKAKRAKPAAKAKAAPPESDVEVETPAKTKSAPPAKKDKSKKKAAAAVPAAPVEPGPSWGERQQAIQSAVKRQITPFRLIGVGISAVIVLTGLWIWHQQALAAATIRLAISGRVGRVALFKGAFQEAETLLQQTRADLDLLGRHDREARELRQLASQATAANNLADTGLFELLGEIRRARQADDRDWGKNVLQMHTGKWFLFETSDIQPAAGKNTVHEFVFPLLTDPEPLSIRMNIDRLLPSMDMAPPKRLLFAAKLSQIREARTGKGVELVLDGESACLLTSPQLLGHLGWPLEPEIQQVVKQQREWLQLPETEEDPLESLGIDLEGLSQPLPEELLP